MTVKGGLQLNFERGEDRYNHKLTSADVRRIHAAVAERERLRAEANKLSNKALADALGVHHRTVEKVVQRITWYHVEPESTA